MADDAIVAKKKRTIHYPSSDVTPLAEIFSILIKCENERACNIYGRVRVVDRHGETFDLFNRDKLSADYICCSPDGGSLSLTAPSDPRLAVIMPSPHVTLDVSLFVTDFDDLPVVKDEITLDRIRNTRAWDEDYRVEHLKGNHGFCGELNFAVFPYAVVANVSVLFFSQYDDFDNLESERYVRPYPDDDDLDSWRMDLCGNQDELEIDGYEKDTCCIPAYLNGTVTATSTGGQSSVLFSKPLWCSVRVKSGGFIKLSRSVVAVPAYSRLKIEASFSHRNTCRARGSVEFKARDSTIIKKDIVGEYGRIRVRVAWSDACDQFHKAERSKQRSGQRVLLEYQRETGAVLSDNHITRRRVADTPMMEVFSIVVCSKDKKGFRFDGEISVWDGVRRIIINKGESHPLCPTSGSGMLAKVGNADSCLNMTDNFTMTLNLKDDTGATMSIGHIFWMSPFTFFLANRRMCSLVQGERGFAVVHYLMFADGMSATVDIKVYGESLPGKVKGKLYARYGNLDYSGSYEEKYYQSILFYDEIDGVACTAASPLPLVKSIVAVPTNTHLIFVADLSLSPNDANAPQAFLKDRVELKDDGSDTIGKHDFRIDVSVQYW